MFHKRQQLKLQLQHAAPAAPVNPAGVFFIHDSTVSTLHGTITDVMQHNESDIGAASWQPETPADQRDGPGLAWLASLGVLVFEGTDAAAFLQGYLTCDTDKLTDTQLTPTVLCDLKGRVGHAVHCLRHSATRRACAGPA